ncbi:daptide biosynthesis RiPP recognition protein [Streptomyces sp. URMC 123]|uniref:daptide biosynthesis RiPP recognition protein n=1 Tax=Streptomyces sp. URMC 123 TaxID=3423403 RepID=UPI003F1B8C6C
MEGLTVDTQRRRKVKEHIRSWASGAQRPSVPADVVATVVAADRDHALALADSPLTGPGTVILAPGGDDPDRNLTGYEGSFTEPGGDVAIGTDGDVYIATQDYATGAFMSVIGPTIVRITHEDDTSLFLKDADEALARGRFPEFLVSPSVILADLPRLHSHYRHTGGPTTRLYVQPDGSLCLSPFLPPIGRLGAGLAELEEADDAEGGLTVRWIGRYLAAVDALRYFALRGFTGLTVSGFGHRLTEHAPLGEDAADLSRPDLPLVLWNEQQAYVTDGKRIFAVGRGAAAVTEAVLTLGKSEAARAVGEEAVTKVTGFFRDRGFDLGVE